MIKLGKKYILLLSFIFVLLMITLGVTYAYFTGGVVGNETSDDIIATSGKVAVTFKDGDQVSLDNILPGDEFTKTFTVENTGTKEAVYTVYLSEVLNLFADIEDIHYYLTSNEANVDVNGVFPAFNSNIVDNIKIGVGEVHNYTLEIQYRDTEEEQNDNMNKELSFKIAINDYKNYGNNLPDDKLNINVTNKVLNVEELKNSNANVGDIIETCGYYEKNDGGAAYYTIENKASQVIDNGLYIELNNGKVAKLMSINNSYNLRQFGAKGDNTSDDYLAFTKAVNVIDNKTLFIPEGTYLTSKPINIKNKTNIKILGVVEKTIIKAANNYTLASCILYFENVNGLAIVGLTLDGNLEENTESEGYTSGNGIRLIGIREGSNITISYNVFENTASDAVRIAKNISSLSVINNYMGNIAYGVRHIEDNNVNDLFIEYNYYTSDRHGGLLYLYDSGIYDGIDVNYNTFSNSSKGRIYIGSKLTDSVSNVNVIGNSLDSVMSGIIITNVNNVIVKSNSIENVTYGGALAFTNCKNMEIFDNNVKSVMQHGLLLDGCSNVYAHGNDLTDCGLGEVKQAFLEVSGSSSNVVIEYNNFKKANTLANEYGIVIKSDGGVAVKSNFLFQTKLLLDSTSANIYVLNNSDILIDNGTNNIIEQGK